MFIFYIAVLYILSFNSLVFSSILPGGGLLGLVIALVLLLPYANKGKIKIQISLGSSWFFILVKYFILQFSVWSIGIFLGFSSSIHQYIIQAVMMLCFILLLLAMEQSVLESLIKAYIIFAAVMALTGFIAWFAIHAGYVGIDEYLFNLRDISGGKVSDLGLHTYSWPYYLGLVLTKVDTDVSGIGSFIFYRASGWAQEPAISAMFVMPAIIILVLDKHIFRKNLRVILTTIIISFWIVCGGVSSIISLSLLIVSGLVLSSIKRSAYWRVVCLITTILLIMAGIFSFGNDIMNMSSFIQSKFNTDSHTFQTSFNSIFWFLYPQPIFVTLMLSLSLLSAIFVSKIAIVGIFRGGYSAIYGYVMLYLVFHCAKGGWGRFIIDPFIMFFFYILVFYTYKQGAFNGVVKCREQKI
jgi:hypothetical protein